MRPERRLVYRLALLLGYASPARMLGEMTAVEWREWLAYLRLEPAGPLRDDLRAALVVTKIHNAWRGREGEPLEPADVFPSLRTAKRGRRRPARQTVEQQQRLLMRLTVMMGGTIQPAAKGK